MAGEALRRTARQRRPQAALTRAARTPGVDASAVASLRGGDAGKPLRALWLLVATTGLRRGELAGLRVQDVDLDVGRVTPRRPRVVVDGRVEESDPKTDSGFRWMALDPVTHRALEDYVDQWREERRQLGQDVLLLFVHAHGQPLHPDTITAYFQDHAKRAGLPRIRLHDVRHSYATAALKSGVPPKVVSERPGHSSVSFTMQVYAHVIPAWTRRRRRRSPA